MGKASYGHDYQIGSGNQAQHIPVEQDHINAKYLLKIFIILPGVLGLLFTPLAQIFFQVCSVANYFGFMEARKKKHLKKETRRLFELGSLYSKIEMTEMGCFALY